MRSQSLCDVQSVVTCLVASQQHRRLLCTHREIVVTLSIGSFEKSELVKQDSVEITNKMQPCNRIYYSTVH